MLPNCPSTKSYFRPIGEQHNYIEAGHTLEIGLNSDRTHFQINAYGQTSNLRYHLPWNSLILAAIKRLPEKKEVRGQHNGKFDAYNLPCTDITVELLAHFIPEANLKFVDDDAKVMFLGILSRAKLQDDVGVMLADYKLKGIVPEHDYELCADKPLSGYQQLALVAEKASAGFGLFAQQGTGKTPIVIADVCNSAKEYREAQLATGKKPEECVPFRVIIVVPNAVRMNWEDEFFNFATQPGKITVLRGTSINRVKQVYDALRVDDVNELYSVVICGYQMLWRSQEVLGLVNWNLAVLDEAHAIKDGKAKQAQACLELRDSAQRRICLTGTPLANSAIDLYMLLEFMEKGNSGFGTFTEFKRFYGVYDTDMATGRDLLVGCQNLPFLQERLARCSFFISKKEAMPDLPEKVYDVVEVEMSDKQAEIYRKVAREIALEIEAVESSDMPRQMMLSCILTKLLRLNQITSGFVSWSEVRDYNELTGEEIVIQPKFIEWCDSVNPKAEALADLLWNKPADEKTIVWACWMPDIEYIMSVCESLGIDAVRYDGTISADDRELVKTRFNEDKNCKVFVGTAASGGAGLNLLGYPPGKPDGYETDCTHIIYYSQNWSQIHRSQSEDRAHRRGTRRQVRITDLVVPSSIDMEIRKRVTNKKEAGIELADLSEILHNISNGNV